MQKMLLDLRFVMRQLAQVAGVCDYGGADAGVWHWRDNGDLLDCGGRAAAAAALSGFGAG